MAHMFVMRFFVRLHSQVYDDAQICRCFTDLPRHLGLFVQDFSSEFIVLSVRSDAEETGGSWGWSVLGEFFWLVPGSQVAPENGGFQ